MALEVPLGFEGISALGADKLGRAVFVTQNLPMIYDISGPFKYAVAAIKTYIRIGLKGGIWRLF